MSTGQSDGLTRAQWLALDVLAIAGDWVKGTSQASSHTQPRVNTRAALGLDHMGFAEGREEFDAGSRHRYEFRITDAGRERRKR